MEQNEAEFGPHVAGSTSQGAAHVHAAAPAALRPLRPPPPSSTKPRRRSFVPPPRPSAPAPSWPTVPVASTVPPHPRQAAPQRSRGGAAPQTMAPAGSRPTVAPAPRRPTVAPPPRPMVPPAPRPMAPPLGLTLPLRQESPASVACDASTAWDAGDNFNPTTAPIFDWTADYSQDPRPSSSQYFTTLMTQNQDADLAFLMQQDPTPVSIGKGPSKRGSNYSHDEDIQLCKSWLNISNDPVTGTDQPGKTYWERIAQDFHENKYSERTTNSLEHRCGVILRDCMLFHGYFEEVQRRRPSGVPEQEHLIEAQARYAKKAGKICPFIHCWLVIRHSEKFEALEMNKRPGKSRGLNLSRESNGSQQQDGGQQESSLGQEESIPTTKKARPPGKKQSKEKLKRDEGDDEYKSLMKNLVVIKNDEHNLRKERWTKDLCLEQRRLEIKERKLQWEQEKQIMFCDVNTLDDDQRTYVLAKRAQFAKMAATSSSESGSVGETGDVVDFSSV